MRGELRLPAPPQLSYTRSLDEVIQTLLFFVVVAFLSLAQQPAALSLQVLELCKYVNQRGWWQDADGHIKGDFRKRVLKTPERHGSFLPLEKVEFPFLQGGSSGHDPKHHSNIILLCFIYRPPTRIVSLSSDATSLGNFWRIVGGGETYFSA